MCLAVPARLIRCKNGEALADLHGNQIEISTALLPEAGIGDWVLIHAGFAIKKLDQNELQESWAVLEDLAASEQEDEPPAGAPRGGIR